MKNSFNIPKVLLLVSCIALSANVCAAGRTASNKSAAKATDCQAMVYTKSKVRLRAAPTDKSAEIAELRKGQYLCVVHQEDPSDRWIQVKAVPFADGRNTLCSNKYENPLCGKAGNYPVRAIGKARLNADKTCRTVASNPSGESIEFRARGNCATGYMTRAAIEYIGD